ncbi:MAG: glycerate kinase [Acetatifactor sp.]|nr:glycerate kinase [Acetatifactor sp.]
MNQKLRSEAEQITEYAIGRVLPDRAVARTLENIPEIHHPSGRIYLAAVGKAAWQMANATVQVLKAPVADGVVVTKYGHVKGDIPGVRCFEGGHPLPDENGLAGTRAILDMTENLTEEDQVLFLVSGGGSALFEKPLISLSALQALKRQLLAVGASITEINTLRKRLSAVKGGRFARWCEPARVEAVILSDVLGDPLDMIASGPAAPDRSTCEEALEIVKKYKLKVTPELRACLEQETPGELDHVTSHVIGSVGQLCLAAAEKCRELGYEVHILTDRLCCEAREAGSFLASMAGSSFASGKRAYIAGGECVVHLHGKGLGGRNQELTLAAAEGLAGIPNAAVFSVGSDGTDGPTDAAGGYVDGDSLAELAARGISLREALAENDSYHALNAIGGLLKTGPTGTNVNDFSVVLIDI